MMSKRIAFCADGTWDSTTKHTNVFKLFSAVTKNSDQHPMYDSGVGADGNPLTRLLGGAFGTGLWQKIKDGYTQIAQVYEAGDEIFVFGFSRGAFTARSLAGMIAVCGLPLKNPTDDLVNTAFSAYRERDENERQALLNKLNDHAMDDAKIKMIGVWDTVGSLGIPAAIGDVDPIFYGFLDTGLHPDVRNAYHALAIDEKRAEFPPTLWTSQPAPGQTLEQVWFCGVHSDIGGGEPDDVEGATALSDITLSWMMSKASALGLQFNAGIQAQYAIPMDPKFSLDTLHTSWTIFAGFPRKRSIANNSVIANSVAIRCQNEFYRPSNLEFVNDVLSPQYGTEDVVSLPEVARGAGQ